MQKQRNALKAGLFIIISVALAFAIVVVVRGTTFETMQMHRASFTLKDNLSGLRVGDEVRVGGFKVGEIRAIEIVSADDPRLAHRTGPISDQAAILVSFTMPTRYALRDDTILAVETTVTEKSCLNVSRLGTGQPLPADVTLVGRPSALYAAMDKLTDAVPRLSNIIAKVEADTIPGINGALADFRGQTLPNVSRTLDGFRAAADSANALVRHVHDQIKPIVDRYTAVTSSAARAMDNIGDLAGDRSSDSDLRGTIKNLRSITASVEQKLPPMLDDLHKTVNDLNATVANTKEVIANLNGAAGSAKSILAGNEAKFHNIVKHLDDTAGNMKSFTEDLRSRPWRLLYTPKKDELYNLALFQSAREFAQGASDLNDATQALHDAVNDQRASPEQIKKLVDQVQEKFGKFQEVEDKLWKAVK